MRSARCTTAQSFLQHPEHRPGEIGDLVDGTRDREESLDIRHLDPEPVHLDAGRSSTAESLPDTPPARTVAHRSRRTASCAARVGPATHPPPRRAPAAAAYRHSQPPIRSGSPSGAPVDRSGSESPRPRCSRGTPRRRRSRLKWARAPRPWRARFDGQRRFDPRSSSNSINRGERPTPFSRLSRWTAAGRPSGSRSKR